MAQKFVSREKMGKKARKQCDALNRRSWDISPVPKIVESRKLYKRHRIDPRSLDRELRGSFF